ncbi:hypothetical protein GCM10027040_21270 [Halomonas shantousis]
MTALTLYTTLGCHLCEQLEAHLAELGPAEASVDRIEISEDPALVARFGERIPVLADEEGAELDRGFERERLAAWLAERGWLREAGRGTPGEPPQPGRRVRHGRRYLG